MQSVTRETRFGELPPDLKQKLVNIHRNSYQQYASVEPLKIAKFGHLYSQMQGIQTRNLRKNFSFISENAERLRRLWNSNKDLQDFKYVHDNLKRALDELKEDVILYKKSENCVEFTDDVIITYSMLESKLKSIIKDEKAS